MANFCRIKSDGTIQNAPNPLRIVVSNPSDERYRYEGWLEKRYTDKPIYNPEKQYLTEHWVQDGIYAVQVWEIKDIIVEDIYEKTAQEG